MGVGRVRPEEASMIGKFLRATALVSLFAGAAWAKARPAVEPVKAGLDPAKLAGLHAALQKYVDSKQIAGAVTVIGRKGHLASFEVVGQRDREAGKPMEPDTVFRIASMSKIATAVAVMMLQEDGKLSVDDPVEKHLPEFRGQKLIKSMNGDTVTLVAPERPITIKDLMTHTSGMNCSLPAGFADLYGKRNRPLAEAVVGFSQHPLISPPGKIWKYCGPAYDTLGRIIEVAGGKKYETFMDERVFRPLGMKDTTFHPTAEQRARLAIIYDKEGDTLKRAERQDFGPENIVYPAASGGLFSTALDYSRLCQMLADRGKAGSKQLLRPETVTKMSSVHFTYAEKVGFTPGLGMGLGVQVVMKPLEVTAMLSPGSFGHGGAFGTQAWVDPKNELYFVLMIQRHNFTEFGNGDMSDMRKTLQEFGEAALAPKTAAAP
jgi:CubicO group peptidase (beta-lactamase class C family)